MLKTLKIFFILNLAVIFFLDGMQYFELVDSIVETKDKPYVTMFLSILEKEDLPAELKQLIKDHGLRLAVHAHNTELVSIFLQAGADPLSLSGDGESAIDIALKEGMISVKSNIIENLLNSKKIPINYQDILGNTMLHKAVNLKNTELVDTLLASKASMFIENKSGVSPLVLASAVKPKLLNIFQDHLPVLEPVSNLLSPDHNKKMLDLSYTIVQLPTTANEYEIARKKEWFDKFFPLQKQHDPISMLFYVAFKNIEKEHPFGFKKPMQPSSKKI